MYSIIIDRADSGKGRIRKLLCSAKKSLFRQKRSRSEPYKADYKSTVAVKVRACDNHQIVNNKVPNKRRTPIYRLKTRLSTT